MKKKIFALLLIAVLIAIALTNLMKSKIAEDEKVDTSSTQVSSDVNTESGLETNQMAPDFTLKTLDGKKAKLSDYRGKKVIVNFWATWCPPCKAEIPHMEKYYKALGKDDNVEILAVNLTKSDKDEDYIKDFVKSYDMTYPVLLDTEGKQQDQYEIVTIPTTYFIDTKGKIQKSINGPMDQEVMKKTIDAIN